MELCAKDSVHYMYPGEERLNYFDFWTHLDSKFGLLDSRNLDFEGAPTGMDFWTLDLDFGFGLLDFSGFGLQVQGHELGSSGFLDFWTFVRSPGSDFLDLSPKSKFQVQSQNLFGPVQKIWESNLDFCPNKSASPPCIEM